MYYCDSADNSHTISNGAMIGYSGSTSVAANDFVLHSTQGPNGEFGIFFYGPNRIKLAFGDGFRCVGGAIARLPVVQTGGAGYVSYSVDLTDPPYASAEITSGSTWNFQFWFRDPSAGGTGWNLSHGLGATFCP